MATNGRPWTHADFLAYFESFLQKHTEFSATRFSYFAANNGALISSLRKGEKNFRLDTLLRAYEFVANYREAAE